MSVPTIQPQLFVLCEPLELIDIVYNDMGEPPEYLFRRVDGSEHEIIGCGGDYVQMLFKQCEVVDDDLHQQIRQLLDDLTIKVMEDALTFRIGEKHREIFIDDHREDSRDECVSAVVAVLEGKKN